MNTDLINTKYNACVDKVYRSTNVYYYKIKCANLECDKLIDVKKGTWESERVKEFPRIFSCCKKCSKSESVCKMHIDNLILKTGYCNNFCRPDVKEKIKKIVLEKYGAENISNTEHFKKKSKETFIKNYGVDNPQKCKEINEKTNKTRIEKYGDDLVGWAVKSKTIQTNLERYGSEWYFSSEEGKQTFENFIKRYGPIDGPLKWESSLKLKRQTLENFIQRYGIEEGNIRYEYWKQTCSNTLENFIRRHGEIEGVKLYDEYSKKRMKILLKNGARTKLNDDFYDILLNYVPFHNIIREFPIKADTQTYFFDFVVDNLNLCIEINGDFWHCNPSKYSSGDYLNFPGRFGKVLVDDIWKKDEKKLKFAQNNGFNVIVFWENDIRNNISDIHFKLKELFL